MQMIEHECWAVYFNKDDYMCVRIIGVGEIKDEQAGHNYWTFLMFAEDEKCIEPIWEVEQMEGMDNMGILYGNITEQKLERVFNTKYGQTTNTNNVEFFKRNKQK